MTGSDDGLCQIRSFFYFNSVNNIAEANQSFLLSAKRRSNGLPIMQYMPMITNGMLRICPISRSMPCSKSTCSFFRNSTKKRNVKIVARQNPKKNPVPTFSRCFI